MNESERRWRLMLGTLSEKSLATAKMNGKDTRRQQALDYLYHQHYQKRGVNTGQSKQGGGHSDNLPAMFDWVNQLPALFPKESCKTILADAIEKFEMTELLKDPKTLEKIEPDQKMLESMLLLKGKLGADVLDQVRKLISQIVAQIQRRLKMQIDSAFSGRRNRNAWSRRPVANNFDWHRSIRKNLKNYHKEKRKIILQHLWFNRRVKQRLPWEVVLCVDQSGSMASSVIYAAIMAGILSSLPSVSVRLVVFDTRVVDLSHVAEDPVETLMTVQLGGGTNIGKALEYCESLVSNPQQTVIALISDFYEGSSEHKLFNITRRLAESKVHLLGLASLNESGGAEYDHNIARRLAAYGMTVGAMTPGHFANWLAEVMDQ